MSKIYEASMAIQMLPNTPEKSIDIRVIDKVIENIQSKGVSMVVCPFETVIEASLNEILDILKESILIAEKEGSTSLLTYVKIAYNPLGVMTIDEKTSKYNK